MLIPACQHRIRLPRTGHRAKRDFSRTAEPAETKVKRTAKGEALRFVVQKHAASRLHFDLRLELDGVLESWAVTKGPAHRLAIGQDGC
jgi:bifunctional non-homologous end joining protein LigD